MDAITVLCGVGILVGLAGIIVPVLPGLILVLGSAALWGLVVRGAAGWTLLGVALAIAALGWTLEYLLPGRRLKEAGVPTSTLVAGAVGAVVGIVLVPGLGLPLGFVAGVVLAELVRRKTFAAAWPSAKHAIVAAAMSFGIELAAGTAIAIAWAVAVWRATS